MDWAGYEERISWAERSAIQLAPLLVMPTPDHVSAYFSDELFQARWKAHVQVSNISAALAKGKLDVEIANVRFAECLAIASFELRHGFIASWPAFALLFYKMFGDAVLPWLPSLFLAALGQGTVPRPQFELEEVLNFHQRHPVASIGKYG